MTGLQLILQRTVLAVVPHGGQKVARRNAWAGMSADAAMARARRDAEAALRLAEAQHALAQPRQEHAVR